MKIIKARKHKVKTKRFRCDWCKSVFIADETEYETHKSETFGYTAYVAECPVCGREAIKLPLF